MANIIDREWRRLQSRERIRTAQEATKYLEAHPNAKGRELAEAIGITFQRADTLIWEFRKRLHAIKKKTGNLGDGTPLPGLQNNKGGL